jgi:predicted phage tail protein
MGKIPGWSTTDAPAGFLYAWKHDDTGYTLAMAENVPNDGYYVMGYEPGEPVRREDGTRFRFDTSQRRARKLAVELMRRYEEGLL